MRSSEAGFDGDGPSAKKKFDFDLKHIDIRRDALKKIDKNVDESVLD